ncbi:MAG: YkvA family protein [Candidatus Korobacteraceae bacterium]
MAGFLKAGSRIGRAWLGTRRFAGQGSAPVGGVRQQWRRFTALIRMLRAWGSGRYRQAPASTLAFALLALVYFLSPIDVVSDFIPVLGLLDDVTVLALVLSAISKDLERFHLWEDQERHTIDAERPASAVS